MHLMITFAVRRLHYKHATASLGVKTCFTKVPFPDPGPGLWLGPPSHEVQHLHLSDMDSRTKARSKQRGRYETFISSDSPIDIVQSRASSESGLTSMHLKGS